MEIYKNYSKIIVEIQEDIKFTFLLWKCFRVDNMTTYSLSDIYQANNKEDLEFSRFIKYLKIDTSTEEWNSRSALVISEEEVVCPYKYCDGESRWLYKFHWLVGDKLNVVSFNPEYIYFE